MPSCRHAMQRDLLISSRMQARVPLMTSAVCGSGKHVRSMLRMSPARVTSDGRQAEALSMEARIRPDSDVPASSASPTPAEADAPKLFDYSYSHIPTWDPSLVLWLPFGCLLAVFRMLLWIGGVLIDHPSFQTQPVASAYLRLLGFKCHWHNTSRLPPGRHILVTNHVTPSDLLVLFEGLPQRYIHLITTAMPHRVTLCKNLPLVLRYATPEELERLANPPPEEQDAAIHLHPEGGLTNGRYGMMQFSRGFTKMMRPGDWVVPVALRAKTPWGIRLHTLNSSFPANFFWTSFCPWVEMQATVLEPMQQLPGEHKGVFARRVQQRIADELGIAVSECNISVKKRIMQQEAKKAKRQL